jgi:hypothetical protein
MDININVIPHHDQRYDTCGDWILDTANHKLEIKISAIDNWRMEFLVAFHEMIEAVLCFDRGIDMQAVDKFDMEFERNRDVGDNSEPGDADDAPYYKEHFFATSLERLMAAELDVDWEEYEDKINKLEY